MAEDLNMNSNDVRDQNVTEEANTIETVKAIQPRSLKRRIERQYELIVKRRGEIVTEGPPHMAAFLKDPVVLQKFKEVALERTVSFHTASGKHAHREGNRPSLWPEHVRFCSPNSSTTDSKRLNVTELRVVIRSYLQNCKHMYTLVDSVEQDEGNGILVDTPDNIDSGIDIITGTDIDRETGIGTGQDNDRGQDIDTGHGIDTETDINKGQDIDRGQDVDRGQDIDRETDRGQDVDREQDIGRETDRGQDVDRGQDIDRETDSHRGQDIDRGQDVDRQQDIDRETDSDRGQDVDRGQDIDKETDSHRGQDIETNSDRGQDVDRGQDIDRETDSHRGQDIDRETDSDRGQDVDRGQDIDREVDSDRVQDVDTERDSYREQDIDRDTDILITDKEMDGKTGVDMTDKQTEQTYSHKVLRFVRKLWNTKLTKDFLLTICEDIRLNASAFLTLRDKVSDEIIDAYMTTLLRVKKSNYVYINCALMSLILHKTFQESVRDYEVTADNIIGLHNIGRRHWVLVIINCCDRTVTVIDPLGELPTTVKTIISSWVKFIQNSNNPSLKIGSSWNVETLPHVKQMDSNSCGIFCLLYSEKYLSREPLFFDIDLLKFRSTVACMIFENQDDESLLKLCRICRQENPRKKKGEKEIQWVGCDECGMYWVHFPCMRTASSYSSLISDKWVCEICSSH